MNEEKPGEEAVDTGTSDSQDSQESAEATSVETSDSSEEASASDDEGTSEEQEEKWLRPGRFKSAEDVLNSYDHLESHTSRLQNDFNNLRRQVEAQSRKPQSDDEIVEFARKAKENPVEAIRSLARQEAQAARDELKAHQFEQKYNNYRQSEEFRKLEPVMVQLAQHFDPVIKAAGMQNDPQLLDALWLMARGQSSAEATAKAESKGKKRGEITAAKKIKAQIEGASGTKGKTNVKIEGLTAEQMKREILKGNIPL